MIVELCNCDGLPWHDHFMGHAEQEVRPGSWVFGPVYDKDDIGRIAVDWKKLAHDLTVGGEENHAE